MFEPAEHDRVDPHSRASCSATATASSSPLIGIVGRSPAVPACAKSAAKLALNAFAVGPFATDFAQADSDSTPSGRPCRGLVASIRIFPSTPLTLRSASSTAPPGTARITASASAASPPSLPRASTS